VAALHNQGMQAFLLISVTASATVAEANDHFLGHDVCCFHHGSTSKKTLFQAFR